MLISVSLENWMSFRDKATFSMVASRERRHAERVPGLDRYHTGVLPIAAFYGGNASGKTNFFKALNFARKLVVDGTRPDKLIPVEPFQLDAASAGQPTRFAFELLIDETMYEYSFAVTRQAVLEERLVEISSNSEKVLYDRRQGRKNLAGALNRKQFLRFAFKGTRGNQLFLTNSISQQIDTFRPVHDWFGDTLTLVAPDSRFDSLGHFFDAGHPHFKTMNETLRKLDTGISHLGLEEIPFENAPFPDALKSRIREDVKEDAVAVIRAEPFNERFVVARENGKLRARRLVSYHRKADGTEARFELRQESDGLQRLIDLLPEFLELSAHGARKVLVLDEVDRSLHPLLTRRLIQTYLAHCTTKTRSQLLLATHDILLMDQQLMRRDELWITERNVAGASTLLSLSEFEDARYDTDIRKSYLQGRLGGIPKFLEGDTLTGLSLARQSEADA